MLVFNNNQPIYQQIVAYFKSQIVASQLQSGSKLPSVRELADQLEVTPNTVQRAYRDLEGEGLIVTHRTSGSYITNDLAKLQVLKREEITAELNLFQEKMKKLGYEGDALLDLLKRHQTGGK